MKLFASSVAQNDENAEDEIFKSLMIYINAQLIFKTDDN